MKRELILKPAEPATSTSHGKVESTCAYYAPVELSPLIVDWFKANEYKDSLDNKTKKLLIDSSQGRNRFRIRFGHHAIKNQIVHLVQEDNDMPVFTVYDAKTTGKHLMDLLYQGRRKTPTIRRIVCSVSEEASVSERLNEQGKPL